MKKEEIKKLASKYIKFVEWSDEDQIYIGRCPELFGGGVHGKDQIKVFEELCVVVEDVIEHQLEEQKKPIKKPVQKFSGKFLVRLQPEFHRAISIKAEDQGISLNQYVLRKLQDA